MSCTKENYSKACSHCGKPAKMICPTCEKLGLPRAVFCGKRCFTKTWKQHKKVHKPAKYKNKIKELDKKAAIEKEARDIANSDPPKSFFDSVEELPEVDEIVENCPICQKPCPSAPGVFGPIEMTIRTRHLCCGRVIHTKCDQIYHERFPGGICLMCKKQMVEPEQHMTKLKEQSKAGHPWAHAMLASRLIGNGLTPKMNWKAHKLLRKAAAAEFVSAYTRLGGDYLNGIPGYLERDYIQAKTWLRKAASIRTYQQKEAKNALQIMDEWALSCAENASRTSDASMVELFKWEKAGCVSPHVSAVARGLYRAGKFKRAGQGIDKDTTSFIEKSITECMFAVISGDAGAIQAKKFYVMAGMIPENIDSMIAEQMKCMPSGATTPLDFTMG